MKKGFWLLPMAALIVVMGLASCIAEDDEDDKKPPEPWTWERIARAIDYQLSPISSGICSPTLGEHCKARFKGTVSQSTLVQMMRVLNDMTLFFGPINTPQSNRALVQNNLGVYFLHGFQPQTANPCEENITADPRADVYESCPGGGIVAQCVSTGNFSYRIVYQDCIWTGPVSAWFPGLNVNWTLNGQVDYVSYSTSYDELVTQATGTDFSILDNANNRKITLNGQATRYLLVNPLTGAQSVGTTGFPDGMIIINTSVALDLDNTPGTVEPDYVLNLANDSEDGLAFLSGLGNAVWSSDMNPAGTIHFFYSGIAGGWNGNNGGGCLVDVLNYGALPVLPPTARTFDIQSQGAYGTNGCVADGVAVTY